MKLSKWVIFAPYPDGQEVLFSTLTGAAVLIDASLASILKETQGRAVTNYLDAEETEALYNLHLLVDDEVDEDALFRYKYNKMRFDATHASITILTTYGCNLNCAYCIQRGTIPSGGARMLPEVIDATARWLEAYYRWKSTRKTDIGWFGGEPLLHLEPIERITTHLRSRLPDLELIGIVVTNGVLLTEENVERLEKAGSFVLQVTLDGPREIHDARRPRKGGQGSFQAVWDGIQRALPRMPVNIAINIDGQNLENIPTLFGMLKQLEPQRNLGVFLGYIAKTLTPQQHCSTHTFNDAEIAEHYGHFFRMAISKGLRVTNCEIIIGLCNWESDAALVIDPEGDIFNCLSAIGMPDVGVGSVFDMDMERFAFRSSPLVSMQTWDEKCYMCSYLPLCRGGCKYQAKVRYGAFAHRNCKKKIFKQAYPEILRLAHEAQVSSAGIIATGSQ